MYTPKYSPEFKDFVKNGQAHPYFIGSGNPDANILFIGKESAIDKNNTNQNTWYEENANDWANHIANNTCEDLCYKVHRKEEIKNQKGDLFEEDHVLLKGWGRNTWSKYQQLTNHIFNKESMPYYIDFTKNVFTTEINDSPSLKTSTADKSKLNERKLLFKNSAFIQRFPVIVLACSNYITNHGDNREIDDIFGVKYKDEYRKKKYNNTNWFFSHYNEDKSKLVIHTRQLSADVKSELLQDMGAVIREHLINIGILTA